MKNVIPQREVATKTLFPLTGRMLDLLHWTFPQKEESVSLPGPQISVRASGQGFAAAAAAAAAAGAAVVPVFRYVKKKSSEARAAVVPVFRYDKVLEALGDALAAVGRTLGESWASLGRSLPDVERLLASLGRSWADLGHQYQWACLGCFLVLLGVWSLTR